MGNLFVEEDEDDSESDRFTSLTNSRQFLDEVPDIDLESVKRDKFPRTKTIKDLDCLLETVQGYQFGMLRQGKRTVSLSYDKSDK